MDDHLHSPEKPHELQNVLCTTAPLQTQTGKRAQLFENDLPRPTVGTPLPARRGQNTRREHEEEETRNLPRLPGSCFEMRSKCQENMSDVPGSETSDGSERTEEAAMTA